MVGPVTTTTTSARHKQTNLNVTSPHKQIYCRSFIMSTTNMSGKRLVFILIYFTKWLQTRTTQRYKLEYCTMQVFPVEDMTLLPEKIDPTRKIRRQWHHFLLGVLTHQTFNNYTTQLMEEETRDKHTVGKASRFRSLFKQSLETKALSHITVILGTLCSSFICRSSGLRQDNNLEKSLNILINGCTHGQLTAWMTREKKDEAVLRF